MTGYWLCAYTNKKIRTEEDVKELISDLIEDSMDTSDFEDWLAEQDDQIVSVFIDYQGGCENLYSDFKKEYAEKTADEIWSCRGDDYEILGHNLVWHDDEVLTTLVIDAQATISYNDKEKTKEQAIAEMFLDTSKFSLFRVSEYKKSEE